MNAVFRLKRNMMQTLLRHAAMTTPRTVPADTIRLARPADAAAVADLVALANAAEFSFDECTRLIRDSTCYVAERDGRIVGACAWTWHRAGAGTARVLALALDPGHPPLALAKLLLTLCESAARRRGLDALDAAPTPHQAWLFLACGFHAVRTTELCRPRINGGPRPVVRRPIGARRPVLAAARPAALPQSYRTFTSAL